MLPFVPSRVSRPTVSAAAVDLFAYSYVDVANPVFTQKYGATKANGRFNQLPQAKRIIIDGTTSTNGNYRHVANLAAALAIYAAGDWILFPGGTTITDNTGWNLNNLAGGVSATQMSVFGTFDQADPENDAKYNTLQCTIDFSGVADTGGGGGSPVVSAINLGAYVAFINFTWYSAIKTEAKSWSLFGNSINAGKQLGFVLFENCLFDGTNAICNSGVTSPGQGLITGSITRSGSTATFTLTTANPSLVTGDIVRIQGATQPEYNIDWPGVAITVLSSTQFTYPVTGTPTTPATGSPTYDPPTSHCPDNFFINDVTYRYCGSLDAGNGTADTKTSGGFFVSGTRRTRWEACVIEHAGYGRGLTRSTSATVGGPSFLAHGLYINTYNEDYSILDCVDGHESSNFKLQGGNAWIQNHVSVRSPTPWIYSSCGDTNTTTYPAGALFRCTHHLAYNSDDMNYSSGENRGDGPSITLTSAGSYYKHGILLNNDSPSGLGRTGLTVADTGGFVGFPSTTMLIDSNTWINWNYQNTSATPDAYTTLTYTNNIWDNASSGSNTQISTLPAGTQAKITAAQALNFHTTLRTAFPTYFSGVSVGANDAATERNMMEFMCRNRIPDPTKAMGWAIVAQYHVRSVLA